MDLATGWAMELIEGYKPHPPLGAGLLSLGPGLPAAARRGGQLGPQCSATTSAGGEIASFDVTLATPQGEVCVEIAGFSIRRMESGAAFAAGANAERRDSRNRRGRAPAVARRGTAAPQPDARHPCRGRGGSVLPRAGRRPVAGDPVLARSRRADRAGRPDRDEPAAADRNSSAPNSTANIVAPEGAIESRLAGFWEDLLGVDQIGVEDSFFDLGGHSLIAVRLFAQIRKTWNVDFPISVLFEAPTIRKWPR